MRGRKTASPSVPASPQRRRSFRDPKPPSSDEGERLHVRIARSGLCSRRAAEELIKQGRVTVNGDLVTEMGVKVTDADTVAVDGMPANIAKTYTLVLFKPA